MNINFLLLTIFAVWAQSCGSNSHGGVFSEALPSQEERELEIQQAQDLFETKWANRKVHEELHHVDIDVIFSKMLQESKHAQTRLEYFNILREGFASLSDGHVIFKAPADFPVIRAASGLKVVPAKEGYVLTGCDGNSPNCAGLDLPAMVTRIDDVPTDKWLRSRKYTPASTAHGKVALELLFLEQSFFPIMSEEELPSSLTLTDSSGASKVHRISWQVQSGNSPWAPPVIQCVSGDWLDETTFYLKLATFYCLPMGTPQESMAAFKAQLEDAIQKVIRSPRHVIVDVRGNGGGYDVSGLDAAAYLTDKRPLWFTISQLQDDGSWENREHYLEPKENWSLFSSSKISVITDGLCASTCDILVAALKDLPSVKVFGQKTHGTTGNPKPWTGPYSGFAVGHPTAKVWTKDGTMVEGKGVTPDVEILPSFQDLSNSNDFVLERVRSLH